MTSISPDVVPKTLPSAPLLEPAFFINLKLEEPDSIFSRIHANKSLSLAKVVSGKVNSLTENLPFEVQDITGFDDLHSDLETGATRLDCKLYGKTPNQLGVYITYEGVVRVEGKVLDVATKKAKDMDFDQGYVTCNPVVELDDGVETQYKWVTKENFIGKGRFVRDEHDSLYVQYFVYIIK